MSESAVILAAQRRYFNSGATLPPAARRAALRRLLDAVTEREDEILNALSEDLGKARMEGYLTEVGIVKSELRAMLRHLDRWARPRRVGTPLAHFPSRSVVWPEPYGVVLVQSRELCDDQAGQRCPGHRCSDRRADRRRLYAPVCACAAPGR